MFLDLEVLLSVFFNCIQATKTVVKSLHGQYNIEDADSQSHIDGYRPIDRKQVDAEIQEVEVNEKLANANDQRDVF